MRKIFLSLPVAFLFCAALCAAPSDTLRILAIGNSFSQDAVEQNLSEIARADGRVAIIGNMYVGGCSLEQHLDFLRNDKAAYQYRKVGVDCIKREMGNRTIPQALADEKWDVISFQQVSGLSGLPTTYEPYLSELYTYVKNHVGPGVQFCWHQTWAYAQGSVHGDFHRYDCDQQKMYSAIVGASSRVCDKYGFKVIPSGTAVQNLRHTCDRDNCTRDGFHLSNSVGRYTAALTWYEALFGRSVLGNSYKPANLDDSRALLAQESAHAAVQRPWEVSLGGKDNFNIIYDEGQVPPYTLPDPLVREDGRRVRSVKEWETVRRPELLSLFASQMYGRAAEPCKLDFEQVSCDSCALGGLALRKEIRMHFKGDGKHYATILLYVPVSVPHAPAFLGLNFGGNETVCDDPGISLPDKAQRERYGVHRYTERGSAAQQWQVRSVLESGFALCTLCADEISPDFENGWAKGLKPIMAVDGDKDYAPDKWGTLAEWAWGLSRVMDYLETEPLVDAGKVALLGFSRMGKAALWAGACDTRFAMVASIQSGTGGAALSRHCIGESLEAINAHFPHWFCGNFKKYGNDLSSLPFDQHELLALIAPRPLFVASAADALWLNPAGEQKAAAEARKVYTSLWGRKAGDRVGTLLRPGKHEVSPEDWEAVIAFAKKNL